MTQIKRVRIIQNGYHYNRPGFSDLIPSHGTCAVYLGEYDNSPFVLVKQDKVVAVSPEQWEKLDRFWKAQGKL